MLTGLGSDIRMLTEVLDTRMLIIVTLGFHQMLTGIHI